MESLVVNFIPDCMLDSGLALVLDDVFSFFDILSDYACTPARRPLCRKIEASPVGPLLLSVKNSEDPFLCFLVIGGSCRVTSSSQVAAVVPVPVFFEVVALFFAGSESDAYLLEG